MAEARIVEARIVKSVINFMLQLSIIAHRDKRLRDNESHHPLIRFCVLRLLRVVLRPLPAMCERTRTRDRGPNVQCPMRFADAMKTRLRARVG